MTEGEGKLSEESIRLLKLIMDLQYNPPDAARCRDAAETILDLLDEIDSLNRQIDAFAGIVRLRQKRRKEERKRDRSGNH